LQVDKKTVLADAGPTRIRRMAATADGEFDLEEIDNLERI